MSDATKHTELPWGIERTETTNWIGPLRPDGKGAHIVCRTDRKSLRADVVERNDADAELVVRAVNSHAELLAALKPVLAEAKERADYMHDTWNPDAHVELTLTIAELRAIRAALARAGQAVPS